jgi:hypothetical protein
VLADAVAEGSFGLELEFELELDAELSALFFAQAAMSMANTNISTETTVLVLFIRFKRISPFGNLFIPCPCSFPHCYPFNLNPLS